MLVSEWIAQAQEHREKLIDLVQNYHPVALQTKRPHPAGPITAPNAERACENVRKEIASKMADRDVLAEFTEALDKGDWRKVSEFLNQATIVSALRWFGVPESTLCWRINGFKEAVELMEELPEETYDRG